MIKYEHKGLTIRISEGLAKAGLMPSGAIQNQGNAVSAIKLLPGEEIESGELFSVEGGGYLHKIWVDGNQVFFQRNEFQIKQNFPKPKKWLHLLAGWDPTSFYIAPHVDHNFDDENVVAKLMTPEIHVPLELYKWAHEMSLLPIATYSSLPHFSSVVVEAIRQAQNVVHDTGSINTFWNNSRGESPVPRDEPHAVASLVALMHDRAVLNGFQLVHEGRAGTGDLDLLAIGPIEGGGHATIAIEAKNAHSPDLFHGLEHQLPTYMKSTNADLGIYLVLWYKNERFTKPDINEQELRINLAERAPLKNIIIHFFDAALRPPPSNRKHRFL